MMHAMLRNIPFLLVLLLLNVALAQSPVPPPPPASTSPTFSASGLSFTDVFSSSGFNRGVPARSLKYGGPCVADIDSDGVYDIILNFHNRNFTRIFLGQGDGTFRIFTDPRTNKPFRPRVLDVHGISVAQLTTRSRDRIIAFSVGGGRGSMLRPVEIYKMTPQREFTDVTREMGFGQNASRPRNTVFMDMTFRSNGERRRDFGGPDILFVNFLLPANGMEQFAYQNVRGTYMPVDMIGDFMQQLRGRVDVTDINGDGRMEVISVRQLRFYQLIDSFNFVDITDAVLPPGVTIGDLSVAATVEIDFDNDGDYDLYVARADRSLTTRRGPDPTADNSDILLRNDGGFYTDVSSSAGIPSGTESIGVSAGDFDNDGYVDLVLVLHDEPDVILLNQRDGTFKRVEGLIPKMPGDIGNNALAVDYDLDGRVDAIVGHGAINGGNLGPYLMMRNVMALTANNHYLHVTVYNDGTGAATSIHAVVTLFMPRRKRMVRRVGSRGGQDSYGSYLDTVHFGTGSVTRINKVLVRWSSGVIKAKRNVPVDQRIFFGTQ